MSIYDYIFEGREEIPEATTMANIAYLPSGVGAVRNAMKSLAQKKRQWNIEVLEDDKGKRVTFDDEFSVFVAKDFWDDFTTMFDEGLKNPTVDLGRYLQEAMDDTIEAERQEIHPALVNLYAEEQFLQIDRIAKIWAARFSAIDYGEVHAPVTTEDKQRDIEDLVGDIYEAYGNDLGGLQMLQDAIAEHESLNAFLVLRDYDFLYGVRIHSEHENVNLTFEATIDYGYLATQSIMIDGADSVLKDLESDESIKVVKNIVYPVGESFEVAFLQGLHTKLEGSDKSGVEHGHTEEN